MSRSQNSYYDTPRNGSAGRKKGGLWSVFDLIMLIVSVVTALSIIISWASRWINPATYGALSTTGLLMPLLFLANILCLLYWVIRWKKKAFIPLSVFVLVIWNVTMFFRPQLTQSHSDLSRDHSLFSVVTYNVRGMMHEVNHEAGTSVSSMNKVISVVDSLNPGILCIQEFQSTRNYPRRYFEEKLPQYNYKKIGYNIGGDGDFGWGAAIYSKFPIVESGHMYFEGTSNILIWADIVVNRDTVRIFNAHLQTTSITASDQAYIVNMGFVTDSTRTRNMRRLAGKLKNNYIIRASQADVLSQKLAESPFPVIVCGDFNDTPMSYTYRRINKGLRDSFREAGHGYGYTYRGFFNMLRIDYIMHSKSMKCVEYVSPSFDCSDHNPVTVKLKMNNH